MMATLYETVPAFNFNEELITCLGDLGRYRMAIDEEDIKEREVWASVAKFWYVKASDKSPRIRRFYHHLDILARPCVLEQLNYYVKSLLCAPPFGPARASVITLFGPILEKEVTTYQRPCGLEIGMITIYGLSFSHDNDKLDSLAAHLMRLLDNRVSRGTVKHFAQGYQIAIMNNASPLGFRYEKGFCMNALSCLIAALRKEEKWTENSSLTQLKNILRYRQRLTSFLFSVGDPDILSLFHVAPVFSDWVLRHPAALVLLKVSFFWQSLATFPDIRHADCESTTIDMRPLPKDYYLRGFLYVDTYLPNRLFGHQATNEDGRNIGKPSAVVQCKGCILCFELLITKCEPYTRSGREKLKFYLSKMAVDTRSISNNEQHGFQSTVTKIVGIAKPITNGVSLMQFTPSSQETDSQAKYSLFWTDSSSSSQCSSVGTSHPVGITLAHEYHAYDDSQSSSLGREAAPCIEGKHTLMKINRLVSLLSHTRAAKRFLLRQFARLSSGKNRTFIIAIAAMFGIFRT